MSYTAEHGGFVGEWQGHEPEPEREGETCPDGYRELSIDDTIEALGEFMKRREQQIRANTPEQDEECPY